MLRRRGAMTSEAPMDQVARASVRRPAVMVRALVPADLVAVPALVNAVLVIAHHRPVVLAIGLFRVRIVVQVALVVRA
jgi:hypothetical protein